MAKLFLSATATPLLVTSVVGQIGDVSEEQVASALNALTDEDRLSYEALKDVPITFSPTQGAEGTAISIYGAGFTGAVGASINGTSLTSFAVASDTLITGVVGAGTTTGKVEVGTAESVADFVIVGSSEYLTFSDALMYLGAKKESEQANIAIDLTDIFIYGGY